MCSKMKFEEIDQWALSNRNGFTDDAFASYLERSSNHGPFGLKGDVWSRVQVSSYWKVSVFVFPGPTGVERVETV